MEQELHGIIANGYRRVHTWSKLANPFLWICTDHEHQLRVRAAMTARRVCGEVVIVFNKNAIRSGLMLPALFLQWLRLRAPRMRHVAQNSGHGSPEESMRQLAVGDYIPAYAQDYALERMGVDNHLVMAVGNALARRREQAAITADARGGRRRLVAERPRRLTANGGARPENASPPALRAGPAEPTHRPSAWGDRSARGHRSTRITSPRTTVGWVPRGPAGRRRRSCGYQVSGRLCCAGAKRGSSLHRSKADQNQCAGDRKRQP